MNSTSLALAKHDKNAPLNVGVSPAKGGWQLSDRWAWAYGLPVSGIARAVAGCIAYHARADTGVSWPGMGDHSRGNRLRSYGHHRGHQGLRAGRARHGAPIQGRQKEREQPIPTPSDGECECKSP